MKGLYGGKYTKRTTELHYDKCMFFHDLTLFGFW